MAAPRTKSSNSVLVDRLETQRLAVAQDIFARMCMGRSTGFEVEFLAEQAFDYADAFLAVANKRCNKG